MAAKWIEFLTGPLEQKKQYRQAKARLDALPDRYRKTADALYRYYLQFGGITEGDVIVQLYLDHADMWERAAIDGTPVSAIVGDDPVEFAENYIQAYGGKHWIDKERARLINAVDEAKKKESES